MNVLIIENDPESLRMLESFLTERNEVASVSISKTEAEAFQHLSQHPTDLVIADLATLGPQAMPVVKRLLYLVPVALACHSPEYAVEAYELGSLDYLLKPITKERCVKTLIKFRAHYTRTKPRSKDTFFVKLNHQLLKLRFDEIVYIEADGDYVKINTDDNKYVVNMGMGMVEETLKGKPFVRIHRSFIVSMEKIEKIIGNQVIMKAVKLPIGNAYKSDFLSLLNILY